MSDTYKELLVKREKSIAGTIGKFFMGALTAVALFLSFVTASIIALTITIALGALTYIIAIHSDLEYEYLYLDKELTIDKIMARSKRKRICTFSVDRMEILAPVKSHHLDSYRNNKQYKEENYSSHRKDSENSVYAMYYDGSKKVLLEADDELMKAIKNNAPRKVFTD